MQAWFEGLKADFELNFIQGQPLGVSGGSLGVTLIITLLAGLLGVVLGVVIAMIRSTYDQTPRARARRSAAGCSACWTSFAAST